ncbi:hypothetical protein AB0F09_18895 [Streptomyces olivaceus]|uniref:hypothetical protein n=1 Tax=Streptomyces olivaceus TaxID=47716 RepID=UPI0033D64088
MSLYSNRLREAVNMTAEEFIIDLLTNGQRLVPGAAVRLIAEIKYIHAHELAERQRAVNFDWYEEDAAGAYLARDHLADMIDPGAPS